MAPGVDGLDYLFAPIAALLVLTLLALLSRWVWSPSRRAAQRDYGLLVPALSVPDEALARQAVGSLRSADIRATLGHSVPRVFVSPTGHAVRHPAAHLVLVFPADLDRAQELLQTSA